jgi:hypothetical protein
VTKKGRKVDILKGCTVGWVDIGIRTTVRLGKVLFVAKVSKICLKTFLVHWPLPHRCTLLGSYSTYGSKILFSQYRVYGFTRFRGILSLIQVYIYEIYVKFCVFWYPSWGGLKKIFWPLLGADALFAAARARDWKNVFCRFCMFHIKMKLLQGDRTPK